MPLCYFIDKAMQESALEVTYGTEKRTVSISGATEAEVNRFKEALQKTKAAYKRKQKREETKEQAKAQVAEAALPVHEP